MSQFRPLSDIAFAIKTHLRTGGTLRDNFGMELVERYSVAAEKIPTIKAMMEESDMNRYDLISVFLAGVDCLMPNPCVLIPVEALAASLVFQEPEKHLHQILLMSDIREHTIPEGEDPWEYKRGALHHWTSARMMEIKIAHDMTYGAAKFEVRDSNSLPTKQTGCLGLILMSGGFLAIGLGVSTHWLTS